jgi:adenylate kinase
VAGRRKLVLLGPPGSGKGTQAAILAGQLRVPHVSTGDMLREAVADGTALGERVAGIMNSGRLVDDDTMAEVVRERLARADARSGFILDGYPRTLPQAETLDRILPAAGDGLNAVLVLEVPEEELVERLGGRGREDDSEAVVRERLRVYREKTEPLVEYYRERRVLRSVDGDAPVEEVTARILEAIG